MKSAPFDYVTPTSLDEATQALVTDGAKALAGGQSLVPLMAFRLARPSLLVDLNRVAGLDELTVEHDGAMLIGAMTRQTRLVRWRDLSRLQPLIAEVIPYIGHAAIRNRGTVGGSLAHADPAAEWPALALVLDAEFRVVGAGGERWVPAAGFFQGPFTADLAPDELLATIRIPAFPAAGWGVCEVARRTGDFALAGALAVVASAGGRISHARLAVFGVASTPVRLPQLEEMLEGASLVEVASILDASLSTSIQPLDDIHARSDYRLHLARAVALQAIQQAWERAHQRRAP